MKKRKFQAAAILLCPLLVLSGCGAQTSGEESPAIEPAASEEAVASTLSTIDTANLFSDRDLAGTYDESAAIPIQLSGDTASCASDAVTVDGGQVIIGAEGIYLLTGVLNDGQIVVNAGETDKVQLVLAGADITSSTSAAIYALEADKVFVTVADGTENTLTNGGEYVAIDDNNIDAVIFAKTDLTLNGSGSLTINAQAGHGVVSKDDLVVTGGSYTITAASHGLSGKDSISISNGTFTIISGKDGIHAENADDLSLGTLYIADGSFSIRAQGDAVSAQGALQIDGGVFDLYTGEGSASVEMTDSSDPGLMGGGQRGSANAPTEVTSTETEEDSVSQKGIKGESTYTVHGGTFTIVSSGDCVDSNGDLTINGGTLDLTCNGNGNTALDCAGSYTNNGGDVTTNDGSENNPGQMGGGKGGAQPGGGRQDGLNDGGRVAGQAAPSAP